MAERDKDMPGRGLLSLALLWVWPGQGCRGREPELHVFLLWIYSCALAQLSGRNLPSLRPTWLFVLLVSQFQGAVVAGTGRGRFWSTVSSQSELALLQRPTRFSPEAAHPWPAGRCCCVSGFCRGES